MKVPVFSEITSLEKELPYYLIGAGTEVEQMMVNRPYGLKTFQCIIPISGKGRIEISNTKSVLSPGQVLITFPNDPHYYYPLEKPWLISWFAFDGYRLEELFYNMNIKSSGIYRLDDIETVKNYITESEMLLSDPEIENKLRGSVLVYSFILHCYNNLHKIHEKKQKLPPTILAPAMRTIMSEYGHQFSIEYLASTCDLSVSHFCRLFKEIHKVRPTEYINSVRIEKAREIMEKNPELKLNNIAKQTGFSHVSYFCSVFKKIIGMTPQEYKESL